MKPETLFTFEKILQAYRACKKRKTNTSNYIEFQMNLEENLFILLRQLKNRTYKPQRSIAFVVKKPKVREIFAATFADRVVHHLLCGYLVPYYERIFIYDSWACRSDKGTVCAMKRLRGFW